MIIVSKSKIDEEASKTAKGKQMYLSQIVRTLMKGIRASNIEKFEELLVPSFSLKEQS